MKPRALTNTDILEELRPRYPEIRDALLKWPKQETPIVVMCAGDTSRSLLLERRALQFAEMRAELRKLGLNGEALEQIRRDPGRGAFWAVWLGNGVCGSARVRVVGLNAAGGEA